MAKTLDKQTMRFAAVLMESLPAISGRTMQYWIETKNRKELKEKLWKALRLFNLVWETVFLTVTTLTEIRKAFVESDKEGLGVHMSDDMKRLLPRLDLTIENSKGVTKRNHVQNRDFKLVGLIRVSVAQLGLENGGTISEVFAQAKAFDLDFCSWQVALNLRLWYRHQPVEDLLYVGIEPALDEDENEVIPFLDNTNEGMFISISQVEPRHVYSPDTEWVFVVALPASAK